MSKITDTQSNFSVIKTIWFLFSLFVVYGAVIPFNFISTRQEVINKISGIGWIPFHAPISDIVQNFLFFIPFGFLGFWVKSKQETWIWPRCIRITILASALSLSVEALQIFTRDRFAGINDVIANSSGAFFGFWMAYSFEKLFIKFISLQKLKEYLRLKAAYPLVVTFVLIIVNQWQPFDFSLDVGRIWPKIRVLISDPFVFNLLFRDELIICFHFFLFSYTLTILLRDAGAKNYLIKSIIFSISIGVFLELSQLIISSRAPTFQDVLTVTTGCLCGGLIADKCKLQFYDNVLCVFVVLITFISAGVRMLSPFEVSYYYRGFNWMPFLGYYELTTFNALSNFIEIMLIYFPLGFILKFLSHRKENVIYVVGIITLSISFTLEYMQGWIQGRYPDITDVIGALVGALVGAWTCSAGWPRYHHYVTRSIQP